MDRYTIKIDLADRMAKYAIDSAVSGAVKRFSDQLGEHEKAAYRVALLAATNAVDLFKTWCNAELRMIEADHEQRADDFLRNPGHLTQFLAQAGVTRTGGDGEAGSVAKP